MKPLTLILFLLLTMVFAPLALNAAVPHLINYQGRLTDKAGQPLEGSQQVTFRIYDAPNAGNQLWNETQPIITQKGVFSVLLGSVSPLNLAFDKPYYLEIQVGNELMTPRQQITSAAYAINAGSAEKIRVNNNDTSPAYLADKIDNTTIKVNPATYKIYAVEKHGSQFFTTSGTFTAPEGVTTVYITMCGGGGGGGGGGYNQGGSRSGGGGGSAGSIVKQPYIVSPGNNYSVSVGVGGTGGLGNGGTGGGTGGNGGTSSFGSLAAGGGSGATGGNTPYDGDGGTGSMVGNICGVKGSYGQGIGGPGGAGGASHFGSGGSGGNVCPGSEGKGFGAGGGGGYCGTNNGGAGKSGFVLVEW